MPQTFQQLRLDLAAALAGSAGGQETGGAQAPAGSTATISSSVAAVVAPEKPAVFRSRVIVHKEAADGEPVSVRLRPAAGGRAIVRLVGGEEIEASRGGAPRLRERLGL